MSKCKYLIDISPYDPLCDHPCRLYGGGAVEAECETCQYRMEDLERENDKLRKMNEAMWLIIRCAIGETSARDGLPVIHEDDLIMLRNMRHDLGIEASE